MYAEEFAVTDRSSVGCKIVRSVQEVVNETKRKSIFAFIGKVGNMDGNRSSVNTSSQLNSKGIGEQFSNDNFLQKSKLKVSDMEQNGVVNRQESSSSLCSWNSFDTSLTDDNSSGTDDVAIDDDNNTKGITITQFKKVFLVAFLIASPALYFTTNLCYCEFFTYCHWCHAGLAEHLI